MSIPFIDLKAQYKEVETAVKKGIDGVLEHGAYVMGPEISKLEERLSSFSAVRHGVGCASGTDALIMALMAFDIGPGDAVFTTPFTFMATAEAIALLGATPVFVDIDPVSFNLDPDDLKRKITGFSSLTAADVTVTQSDDAVEVTVGESDRQAPNTVVILELDGPATPDICK